MIGISTSTAVDPKLPGRSRASAISRQAVSLHPIVELLYGHVENTERFAVAFQPNQIVSTMLFHFLSFSL